VLRRSQRCREKHGQSCGPSASSGGPVGIVSDGKAYLVVGEHKPMNDQLAEYCGKTITLKGKMAERGGIAMIENAEIVRNKYRHRLSGTAGSSKDSTAFKLGDGDLAPRELLTYSTASKTARSLPIRRAFSIC
jgi:hypothetical protein